MELEEHSDHGDDDECPVVSVAATGEHAVLTPEVLSHAPRSEDTEHEASKNAAEVYVGEGFAETEGTLSLVLFDVSSVKFLVIINDIDVEFQPLVGVVVH